MCCAEEDIWAKEGGCSRRLEEFYIEKLYGLYSSPNIIQVIKSRRIMCTGHVAHTGHRRDAYRVLIGKAKETIWKIYK
jgi:hypothetical protein